ncbi:MAG: HlyD family type I secretion periplasmic adaptor subunit [Gammaproteobacteria bacterium]|nr:HlyD family type I secretion periplasmic adaptor subunit [Gammaproteobacteria bacterium]
MKAKNRPEIKLIIIYSAVVIVLFIGGFFTWATLATLESAAIAPGSVIVAGNRRVIQHFEGGIIQKIYVKDGSYVKKNALLIKLKDVKAKAVSDINQHEFWTLIGTQARIYAELDHDTIQFPSQLLHSNEPKVKSIVALQHHIFKANKKHIDSNLGIYQQQIQQLEQEITGIQAVIKSNDEQRVFIEKELNDAKILVKKRLIKQSRYYALQREFSAITGKKGQLAAKLAELQQKIGETELQINAIKDKHRKTLLDELNDIQTKLNEIQQRQKTGQDILSRTEIRSPIDGTIVNLKFHTQGGIIKSGEPIMDIVPKHEILIIGAKLSPLDIDAVHPGLKAKVTLTGLSQRNAPRLIGTVTHVSADALTDPNTQKTYFQVKIKIPEDQLKKLSHVTLYPGMPAEAMLITNKSSPWAYFTKPIVKSFDRAFRED